MSVYFLHIPRTSGIYISNNVLPHLISGGIPHFVSNRTTINTDHIKNCEYVSGHFGRLPIDLMENPIIYSIVRNPIERYISYFKYTTGLIRSKSEIYKKLDAWLYGDKVEVNSNMQSKFLTGKMNYEQFNKDVVVNIDFDQNHRASPVANGWYMEDYSLNINDIIKAINEMNVYTLDNHNAFKKDFNNELKKQFNFTTFKYDDRHNQSHNIGLDLTKKQLKRIEELNLVDMEIYEYVRKNQKKY